MFLRALACQCAVCSSHFSTVFYSFLPPTLITLVSLSNAINLFTHVDSPAHFAHTIDLNARLVPLYRCHSAPNCHSIHSSHFTRSLRSLCSLNRTVSLLQLPPGQLTRSLRSLYSLHRLSAAVTPVSLRFLHHWCQQRNVAQCSVVSTSSRRSEWW